jgi:hypothetical protein
MMFRLFIAFFLLSTSRVEYLSMRIIMLIVMMSRAFILFHIVMFCILLLLWEVIVLLLIILVVVVTPVFLVSARSCGAISSETFPSLVTIISCLSIGRLRSIILDMSTADSRLCLVATIVVILMVWLLRVGVAIQPGALIWLLISIFLIPTIMVLPHCSTPANVVGMSRDTLIRILSHLGFPLIDITSAI